MSRTNRFTFKQCLPQIWKQAQDAAEMAVEEAMQEVCHDERPCGVCVKISRSEPGLTEDFIDFLIANLPANSYQNDDEYYYLKYTGILPTSNTHRNIRYTSVQHACVEACQSVLASYSIKSRIC